MNGWIKLHRKFQEWEWYKTDYMVQLFVHLLLSANREDGSWHNIEIKRGELVTSIMSLCSETGISVRSIRTCLDRLKATCELTIKTTNKFSIITICNYDNYQFVDDTTDKQNDTQPDNKQEKKNKKKKNTTAIDSEKIVFSENVRLTQKEYDTFISKYGKDVFDGMIEKLSAYKLAKGKHYDSDAGAIRSWVADSYLEKHKTKKAVFVP